VRRERGFALLTALWLVTALAVFAAGAIGVAHLGTLTTRNRVLLARAAWAREACLAILDARYAADPAVRALDTVDLGRGVWCHVALDDPGARLDLNSATPAVLRRLAWRAGVSRADAERWLAAISERRVRGDIVDPAEINELFLRPPSPRMWRGGQGERHDHGGQGERNDQGGQGERNWARLAPLITTRGTGQVNLNAAPSAVLGAIEGMTDEAVRVALERRGRGQPVRSVDELAGLLSPVARAVLIADYPEFLRTTTFAPTQLVATATGGVRGTRLVARAIVTVVPVEGRLAVIRRETE
jgi:hypothetical protein